MSKAFAVVCAAVMALATLGAQAADVTLRIHSWIPNHPVNTVVWKTWSDEIKAATEGRVTTEITFPPVHPKVFSDRLRDGISDAAWSFHGYTPGRFVLTKIVELPFLDANAEQASVAYWRVHERHLAKANEHEGFRLLALMSHGPGVIHTKKPISSLADLEGMKIRSGGGVMGDIVKALGVVGFLAPAPEVFQILKDGVGDGLFMPIEVQKSLNIMEVTTHVTMVPGGLYMGSFFLGMNQAVYDKLSAADRKAVDEASGERLARAAGKMWDDADRVGIEGAKAKGIVISTASDQLTREVRERLAGIEAEWVKEAADKTGVDAAAALSDLRAEVKKLQSM